MFFGFVCSGDFFKMKSYSCHRKKGHRLTYTKLFDRDAERPVEAQAVVTWWVGNAVPVYDYF